MKAEDSTGLALVFSFMAPFLGTTYFLFAKVLPILGVDVFDATRERTLGSLGLVLLTIPVAALVGLLVAGLALPPLMRMLVNKEEAQFILRRWGWIHVPILSDIFIWSFTMVYGEKPKVAVEV